MRTSCATPLAALRLTVELMRRDNDVGAAAGDLKLIDQQVSNLARLVDDLLDVTRMRQGKINLRKVPIDLRTVVESAIQSIKPDVDSKGLALSVELPRECVYVDGDAARLEQAVVNLLDNAMKYTDTGGRIGVALTADLRTRCCACRTRASAFARRCCRAFSTFSARTKAR